MVKPFEMLYIVPAQYTEAEVEGVKQKVGALLEKAGAKVIRHEALAKIRLAYPIKKVRHGTYVLAQYDADGSANTDLERSLRLTDEVLRHQIVARVPGAEAEKFEISAYVAPLSEEAREASPRPGFRDAAPRRPTASVPVRPAAPVAAKAVDPSISVEELDKRLDALLDEDVSKTA